MKLLLTGLPRSGKTTLIKRLAELVPQGSTVFSHEVRDADGNRAGFEARINGSEPVIFAHKQLIESDNLVGDYKVDLVAIEKLFVSSIDDAIKRGGWLIFDEIGRMQMLSPRFAPAVKRLLESDLNLLATIRYGDDWTKEFTNHDGVQLFTLTEENRGEIERRLRELIT